MSDSSPSGRTDLERLRIREADRRPKRHRRRWPFFAIGIAVLIAAISILSRPTPIRVATARIGGSGPAEAGGSVLTANGYVEARHQASVAARTTGRLASLLVEEGDPVDSNQVVARLIDEDQVAALRQAEANLALARARVEQAKALETESQRRHDRRRELLAQETISEEEAQGAETDLASARAERLAAEAGVKVAQAAVESARLELDKTRVTAPFGGVVLRKDAEVGEIVGPIMTSNTARAGAVVTIADMQTLEVGVDINESYIARLFIGMPADVVLDAHPEVHFPADVRAIFPSADRDKATVPVRVRFLVDDPRIRPDLGAKVSFLKERQSAEIQTIKKTLRIPASALRATDGESSVMVLREGKAEPAEVVVGERLGEEVEILSGLNEGDQVIADGSARIAKGKRVKPVAP